MNPGQVFFIATHRPAEPKFGRSLSGYGVHELLSEALRQISAEDDCRHTQDMRADIVNAIATYADFNREREAP